MFVMLLVSVSKGKSCTCSMFRAMLRYRTGLPQKTLKLLEVMQAPLDPKVTD